MLIKSIQFCVLIVKCRLCPKKSLEFQNQGMLRFRGLKSQYLPRGNYTQLFKYLGINWKTSMEFLLNLNFLLWAGEFTENPWQHIKLSHLSLQTRFFVLRHLRKQQFRIFNMKNRKLRIIQRFSFLELFRQMRILCNSAAKGFFYPPSFPPHQNFNSTSN